MDATEITNDFFDTYSAELYRNKCMIPLYVHKRIIVDDTIYSNGDVYSTYDHSYRKMVSLYKNGMISFTRSQDKSNRLFIVQRAQNPLDVTNAIGYAIYSPVIRKLNGSEFRSCVFLYTESEEEADFLCSQLNDYLRD